MSSMAPVWEQLGTKIASFMFTCVMFKQFFPQWLGTYLERLKNKFIRYFFPQVKITFHEFTPSSYRCSEAFTHIETYLGSKSTASSSRIIGEKSKARNDVALSMDASEEFADEFKGIKVSWYLNVYIPQTKAIAWSSYDMEKRSYVLTFHNKHRSFVTGDYLQHVMRKGEEIAVMSRVQKIYSNNPSDQWKDYKRNLWSASTFKHPASFKTLALDSKLNEEILNDLVAFREGGNYYEKVGKAWKRGYLLYGPPGTGKSTLIVAMANLLKYDIYDLELTAIKDNTQLRKLASLIPSKSIIVIEDLDCSLDVTGHREDKKKDEESDSDSSDPVSNPITKKLKEKEKGSDDSKVTLSGLLNFMDGLWSGCASERIIVVTTNHVDKLDPALIRRGRMDKHIELSYCGFDAFKVLAKNYLDIESHELFGTIKELLEKHNMTPADVAENLMPKTLCGDFVETCLKDLIEAIQTSPKKGENEDKDKRKDEVSEVKSGTEEEKDSYAQVE